MLRKRLLFLGGGLAVLAALAVVLAVNLWVLPDSAEAQQPPDSQLPNHMQQRVDQMINVLRSDPGPDAVGQAIDEILAVTYGGLRPLPSPGLPQAEDAHRAVGEVEMQMARALEEFIRKGKNSEEQKGRALELKLLLEMTHEVAMALAPITAQCGEEPEGQPQRGACDELAPLLDEDTGLEGPVNDSINNRPAIRPSYEVKLRGPHIPPWFRGWNEDVLISDPIADGECVVVFKETRGLMLRLHYDRVIKVNDPWVSTFGLPRGTLIPVWTLEWVPSEYVKEWNLCNNGGKINKTVSKRVVQDIPLKYFWKYYGTGKKY